jgi:phosphonate transport system substrate-binding protein
MSAPLVVGAVLYDPKVAVIWDIIRDFFDTSGCPIDMVFYTNYELQVSGLLSGHLDIAWNSPLAWLDSQRQSGGRCQAIAMRDTDRDRVSHVVVRKDRGITKVGDLSGRTVAVGAKDSPQATLIPIGLLQRSGLQPNESITIRRFDVLVGKHGDHIGGEFEAFRSLQRGEVDASTMLDLNWDTWRQDGTLDPAQYHVLATTDRFDHCVFTIREDLAPAQRQAWLDVLFSMSYRNPRHREMMDLEGLRAWLPGRTTGFGALEEATARQGFFLRGA